ncbi:MAG: hypothetical protein J3K34DRAFT_119082 [Monoraphidium minutum]|nr:MAG: hypothetical protein J3K34DRAFT_119082 [Monoraphidium minutum]
MRARARARNAAAAAQCCRCRAQHGHALLCLRGASGGAPGGGGTPGGSGVPGGGGTPSSAGRRAPSPFAQATAHPLLFFTFANARTAKLCACPTAGAAQAGCVACAWRARRGALRGCAAFLYLPPHARGCAAAGPARGCRKSVSSSGKRRGRMGACAPTTSTCNWYWLRLSAPFGNARKLLRGPRPGQFRPRAGGTRLGPFSRH